MAEKLPESNSGYSTLPAPKASVLSSFLKLLRNKLLLTFVFLALAVFAANLVFFTGCNSLHSIEAKADPSGGDHNSPTAFAKKILPDNVRIFIGMAIITICLGSMIYLLVRKIIGPLVRLCEAAEEVSRGNLSSTAPSGSDDEIGKLGALVNDLSSNFQEVLLAMAALVGSSKSALDKLERSLAASPMKASSEVNEQIGFLKSDLGKIESMAKEFDFYHARLEDGKVFAKPGEEEAG